MLNEERRRAILDMMQHDGRVLVADLAQQFQTSQVTIRKDLEILHVRGLVHRTHGGALPTRQGALEDPTLREKAKLYRKEKLAIAKSSFWIRVLRRPRSRGPSAISKI
jgi:DeoR family transcriptional regulator of aga operon